MPAKPAPAEHLNIRTKTLYGLGSISFGVHIALYSLLLFFYNQVVGVPAQTVGAALAISLVLDAIWDPLLGHISDNTRTRWGRRHPYLYASAIPIAISVVLLFNPPLAGTDSQKFVWLLAFVITSRLFMSLYEMPSAALAPELAPDYHDRTTLVAYRWVFLVLGTVAINVLGFLWFFRKTPQYPQGQLNPAGWGPLGLAAAALMLGSILISAWGTHDRISSLHRPPIRKASLGQNLRDIGATLRNWNLGVVLTGSFIGGLSFGIYGGLMLYLRTFFWGLPAVEIGALALADLAATFLAAVVAAAVSRRLGKRRACVILFFTSLAILQGPILLRLLGAFPGPGNPVLFPLLLLQSFCWGILGNAGFIVVSSMVADITEDVQVKTGRRAEGLLFSTNTFITKAMTGVSALLPGLMLAFVHFPARAAPATIDPAVVRSLFWLYVPITTTLSFLSISCYLAYRIDEAGHERNIATIREAEALAEAGMESGSETAAAARLAG